MGILNVTPDSFSDGGRYTQADSIARRIDQLLDEGADLIDVGGESTRPGAAAVDADEQLRRVLGPVSRAATAGAIVSIDTTLPVVARAACEAGAVVINDVSCLADEALARVAVETQGWLLVMHSLGSMTGFVKADDDLYSDVVAEVVAALAQARLRALAQGITPDRFWVDPGLGFHKSADHSYTLLGRLGALRTLGPVVVGASRKSFLGRDVAAPPVDRLGGTIAASLAAARAGASVLRVHDVLALRQALAVARAIDEEGRSPGGA